MYFLESVCTMSSSPESRKDWCRNITPNYNSPQKRKKSNSKAHRFITHTYYSQTKMIHLGPLRGSLAFQAV